MIIVRLGEIIFNATEVPQRINGGGEQLEKVTQCVGGLRVVDTLGRSDDDIVFSGLFTGILSLARVKYLDTLRANGDQVSFSYSAFNYNVIVKSFKFTMRIGYQIDYSITLTVVQDLTIPVNIAIPISFSDAIQSAYTEALDLAQFLSIGGVLGKISAVGLAIEAAQDLNNLTISEISSISNAISGAVSEIDSVINSIPVS